MPDLAVILVTWNTRQLVLDALRTLQADLSTSQLDSKVWLVDNASTDGTADAVRAAFPDVHLIASEKNLGFGGGNNLALRALGFHDQPSANPNGPRAVFLLNPDTLVQLGAVDTLYRALFDLPRAGLVGAQLAYGDGTFQHGAFRFPGLMQIVIDLFPLPNRVHGRLYESRFNGRYRRALYASGKPFPVDFTLGATMMFRREAIEQTGLFDEQFFMYCEEIDWSMRIRRAGFAIYTVPAARITHLEGKSTGQVRPQSLLNLWTSRLRLFQKHDAPLKLAAARQLIRLGMGFQIRRARQNSALHDTQRAALVGAYQQIRERAGKIIMTLTAIILTYNEATNIAACIDSLRWADSILVFDSFSTDDTVQIAEKAGARVIQHPWTNYSVQRDAALQAVTDEWVFFVDADERSTPEQADEIRRRIADPAFDGYWVPRHNYIFGKLTRHTGWYPDYQLRVLRRASARYDLTREVHELVILDGEAGYLVTPLIHYNYRDLAQFRHKQEIYTNHAVSDLFKQGIRVKPQNYVLQPLRQFYWRFVTLQGYRDGLHGLRLSLLMAWYEFQKYVRLRRVWRAAG